MDWTLFDYVFAFALIASVIVTYMYAARRTANTTYRIAIAVALAAAFVLVWSNGAVGLIGSENNDANMLYGGVLLVAVIGAVVARLRPAGMALALYAAALAQVLVPVIALLSGLAAAELIWSPDTLVITVFFTALWLLSARLFRKAAGPAASIP